MRETLPDNDDKKSTGEGRATISSMLHDDLGAPVDRPGPPRTVVSLVPSLTEAIATSRPDLLTGATDWCTHPAGLDVPRFRGTKNPDVKALITAAPDLIICNQEENRELDVRRLREAGLAVWVTRIETLAEAFGSMRRLFTEALDTEVPSWLVLAETNWAEPARLDLSAVTPIWRDPWMVVGGRTFTDDLLLRLGVRNPFSDQAGRYPHTDIAAIQASRPDVVLLPDEPYVFSEVDGPEAFPDQRTALISGRLLTWYGPSLVSARAEIEAVLSSV